MMRNRKVADDYDALLRLTTEARTGTASESHSFGYDLAGTLTSQDGTDIS
ncbi:MAG: hypothetical protein ACLQVD_00600 [Capsulimonadaceae bacterium]